MTEIPATLTFAEAARIVLGPVKDQSYRATTAAGTPRHAAQRAAACSAAAALVDPPKAHSRGRALMPTLPDTAAEQTQTTNAAPERTARAESEPRSRPA